MSDIRARIKRDGPKSVIVEIFEEGEIGPILVAIAILLVVGIFWLLYEILSHKTSRNIFLCVLAVVFILHLILTALDPFSGEDVLYALSDDGEYYCVSGVKNKSATNVTIPSTIDKKPVKYISDSALYEFTEVKTIVIESGITDIGASAFENCKNLESITLPDTLINIGDSAFKNCDSLKTVKIPNSVKCIGDSAFDGCSSLTTVTMPNSITSIGNSAFLGCDALTSITLPNGLKSISEKMFFCCTSLTNVTIPNSVTTIEEDAFYRCESLTSITLPNSINNIGNTAISHCKNLITIYFKGTTQQWGSINKVEGKWSSIDGILDWDYGTYNYTIHCTDGIFEEP